MEHVPHRCEDIMALGRYGICPTHVNLNKKEPRQCGDSFSFLEEAGEEKGEIIGGSDFVNEKPDGLSDPLQDQV